MGRVFVAGSINMDVVATADRHPRIGETVAGNAVLYFPGGKGANQAVAAAKLGAPTTLIGRLGKDAFGDELKAFLAAQAIDLSFVRETAEAHTGTAIITVANADNTIVVIPRANALVDAGDVVAPVLATSDVAVSQFEIPLPTIVAFFVHAGGVAAGLSAGNSIRDALAYANVAASSCVQRMGAAPSMPTAAEVAFAISTSRPCESRDP